ncbi:MAG: HesB/IscA family protein [Candidatus Binatales bacterium]
MAEELHEEQAPNGREHDSNSASAPDAAVKVTPKALEVVKAMIAKEKLGAESGLRIGVTGGGCSGFQYALSFDSHKEGDIVTVLDGVQVFVDELSQPYIGGTTLDYVEGLHNAGFRFDNPRASRTCGCGSSFSA